MIRGGIGSDQRAVETPLKLFPTASSTSHSASALVVSSVPIRLSVPSTAGWVVGTVPVPL